MADPDDQVQLSGTDARSGASTHVTRYVLGISMVLIIVIFAYLLMR